MYDLKPCKFCGEIPFVCKYPNGLYGVECSFYACNSVEVVMGDTKAEAVEAWNAEQEVEE